MSESNASTRLLLLPGLGADARLFGDLAAVREAPRFEVPRWLPPQRGESIRAYADRWAEQLGPQLDDGRPLVLGGMSFGGQVALELARTLRPAAVALISCHRRSDELTPRFLRQVKVLPWLPGPVVRWGMRRIAMPAIAREEQLSADQRACLLAMARDVDLPFFRWASKAAANWRWSAADEADLESVHALFGERDSIIPTSPIEPHRQVIRGAGHLIQMSHPIEVAAWLARVVDGLAAG